MFILVSGATVTVNELIHKHPNLGVLMVPRAGNALPPKGTVWGADNGAFSGFDDALFRQFLKKLEGRSDCKFVACPDVVSDSQATMDLYSQWAPVIREHGLTPALVAQDGLTIRGVPWGDVQAIFIGGSTRYKTGEAAAEIVIEGNRRFLWTHMGRVNTASRILFAAALGVRSVDGSGFSRFSNTHLPWALRLARQIPLGLKT